MAEPVKVIGGGFSGMIASYCLAKNGRRVILEEEKDRLGGIISTTDTFWGPAENAASGIMNSPLVEEFFQDLQIEPAEKSPFFKKKYIYRDGQLRRWPLRLAESGRLLMALPALLSGKASPRENESIEKWAERVIGRGAMNYLLEPALQGIYAGDPKHLSASLILGKFFNREKTQHNTSLKYGRGTLAPAGGMGRLIERLAGHIEELGVDIQLNRPAEWNPERKTVLAVPAWRAAEMVKDSLPEAAASLRSMEYSPLASVTLFYPAGDELRGFGGLFPPSEGFQSLGVLLTDGLFLQGREFSAERWILGGALNKKISGQQENEIVQLAMADSEKLYGRRREAVGFYVKKWSKAVPHYTLELEEKLRKLPVSENLVFFGNYNAHLGLKQILHAAHDLAEQWREPEWRRR